MSRYTCKACGWLGERPSISDASEARVDFDGRLFVDRVHICVCPRCFQAVRQVSQDPKPSPSGDSAGSGDMPGHSEAGARLPAPGAKRHHGAEPCQLAPAGITQAGRYGPVFNHLEESHA